jgi:hypothetical protein
VTAQRFASSLDGEGAHVQKCDEPVQTDRSAFELPGEAPMMQCVCRTVSMSPPTFSA